MTSFNLYYMSLLSNSISMPNAESSPLIPISFFQTDLHMENKKLHSTKAKGEDSKFWTKYETIRSYSRKQRIDMHPNHEETRCQDMYKEEVAKGLMLSEDYVYHLSRGEIILLTFFKQMSM